MSGIHSCSYFCTRPACVAVQRDELRDRLAEPVAVQAEPVSTEPIATVYRDADTLLCEFGESNAAM